MWPVTVALTIASCAQAFVPAFQRRQSAVFDWYALPAADNISWTPCFSGQLCARLNLPLDHASADGPRVQVALQMVPATDKANYKGTILLNPGGPGGSGTQTVLGRGAALAGLLGPSFDILGFDPRGTGATTPLARCFSSPELSDGWRLTEVSALRQHDASILQARARDQTLSALCESTLGGNGREDVGGSAADWGPARFMDTASVATDMLRIVEALGQEKLQYYGTSYGTLLGQYFAAMYPDRIQRMVLDGVVDGTKWQNGQELNIPDADHVMDAFFTDCVQAGPSNCAIWEQDAAAISERLDRILVDLRHNPLTLHGTSAGPALLTEDMVLQLIFSRGLYTPLDGFPLIADGARAIETRNASFWSEVPLFTSDVGIPPWLQSNQAEQAVACSDFPPLSDSLSADIAAVASSTRLSKWGGPFGARMRVTCGAWRTRAKARYTGPVSAKLDVPVLVLSNKFDPVTPLSAARAVVSRFEGMRLLAQNTVGHTVAQSPSMCVAKAVAAYFQTGTLPAEGTVCQPDIIPLVGPVPSAPSS